MLNNVSWQAYWMVLALLSAGYYLAIYLLYFRKDFNVLLPSKGDSKPEKTTSTFVPYFSSSGVSDPPVDPSVSDRHTLLSQHSDGEIIPEENASFYTSLSGSEDAIFESLIDELNAFFESVRRTKPVKEELLYVLGRIIKKHPIEKKSFFAESVNNYITVQAEHICSLHLTAGDLAIVWIEG